MSSKNRKRKNKKNLKIVAFSFILVGFLLLGYSAFMLRDYLFIRDKVISPVGRNYKKPENKLLPLLKTAKISISNFSIATDSSYVVSLVDNGTVVFDPLKNLDTQVQSLQIILSRLTIEGKRFKNLDFRFDKPVVAF